MPLPDDKIPELCLKWANGNQDAANFLVLWSRIVRNADDIADGDSKSPVPDMSVLLVNCIVGLSTNAFFKANSASLIPVMTNAIAMWVKSEEWRKSTITKTRMFGFVGRESVEDVAHSVALLTGGYAHMLQVIEEIQQISHQSSPETFEDWINEGAK